MVTELFVPERKIVVPKPPSYLKLDMAFAIGAGAKLMDKSRYRSHGTISGADWATGAHGKCLDFVSTVPDYVEIPAAFTQLDFTTQKFTFIFRFKVDDLTVARTLFDRMIWNKEGYFFLVDTDGRFRFFSLTAGEYRESSTAAGAILTDTWYTGGLSRDGASVIPYKNGVDVHHTVGTHIDPVTSTQPAVIGARSYDYSYPFDGKIEFLRIFGGIALPASAHLAYHNALA